jgi:prepilin-type N-terminal cleavage/methylation domain-containing protein
MNRASHDPRTAGFTLAELLVSLVIAGFLAGVILQLVTSQARFTDIQYARQEVQDNARGTLELMGSELRAVPLPGGLLMAGEDTIRFHSPIVWGVYCGSTSTNSRWVVFDKSVWVTAAAGGIPMQAGLALQRTQGSADGTVPPIFDSHSTATRGDTLAPAAAAASPCGGLMDDPTRTVVVKFDNVPTTVPGSPGLAAYVWRTVAYGAGAGSADERWMTRELGGSGDPEVLAGPIDSLTIRYLNAAGVAFTAPVEATKRDSVRNVRVIVKMKARKGTGASSGNRRVSTKDSITVSLRNFR